jgi:purine-binding chemotaxis protein CheW
MEPLGEGVARVDLLAVYAPERIRPSAIIDAQSDQPPDACYGRMSVKPAPAGPDGLARAPAGVLVFRLDSLRCAVDASAVVEVVAAVATRPLPGQPAYLAGVIDLRGTVVPVVDLRVRFGRPARPMELSDRLVVARARGNLVALWVDEVEGLMSGADAAVTSGGLLVGDDSLAGVTSTPNGLATIHDVAAFVAQCQADAVYESLGR